MHKMHTTKSVSDDHLSQTQLIDLHAVIWFWSSILFIFHFYLKGHFLNRVLKLLSQNEKLEIFSLQFIAQNANSKNIGLVSL